MDITLEVAEADALYKRARAAAEAGDWETHDLLVKQADAIYERLESEGEKV